ncbi:hypothetical protein OKC48_04085 [Methylorubrum extorquens]|uniref:hypothetical protein n=1 Tax=Methylorubrum extorquens TaxID=408 RepID=UPI0022374F0D|nr:hypothetical protein [Methylorubrum extorquens]UYW27699.1 hypothetical protein OKC48_04085 [Methylorubrum extorquens]
MFQELEARKRQIAQQYHYQRRRSTKLNEPFAINHREWMSIWRCQRDPMLPGRIVRADSSKPWSPANCVFERCDDMALPQLIHQGVRTLTVGEWVREMKAKR